MQNDSAYEQTVEKGPEQPEWVRILPERTSLAWGRMRQWTLVLSARRIPHRRLKTGTGWHLLVPPSYLTLAEKEITLFEQENLNWPPPAEHPALADNSLITLSVLGVLAIFYNVTLMDIQAFGHAPVDWIGLGNADAHKILNGQWWRTVTALTLHADALHLLGNIGIGGFFLVLVCRQLGSGLGWSLVLLSGSAGNLLNAWVYHSDHRSVGASTALFGAVGLLAGIRMAQKRHPLTRGWLWPLAAALALLALLGVGDENTDIGAHLFGFMAGIMPGLLAGRHLRRAGQPSPWVNVLLTILALLTVLLAWTLALHLSA
ncbi:rhomboid family intramembrane serine protease [Desulfuromonas sp. AOP6]|uniref:rhomboid family intramembrane serine protease n=1 Tax=Desulfuromonas sp. AOP6 TaxID=1566351 RepID=UPI00128A74C7|nr:rhomboid family intramembrane serine protease [Desulfuromonas sp. AOP6]BCA80822.1 rhomboid family intramembrane serine protease [Desulfuromonas sp. AOP6]